MNTIHSNTCKNCGANINDNYCAICGQKTSIDKLTFRETFQDMVEALFTIDAPLLITLKMLVINPGKLFTEYLSGKRKKYYKPVTFFILMTVIYLVIRSIINYDPFGSTVLKVDDPTQSQLLIKARNFMLLNIDKFLFVYVLSLGVFMKLFYIKKNTLVEFLAISFFLLGVYTILTTLNMFYIQYINVSFQGLNIIIMLLYFVYAMVSYFKTNKVQIILKSIIVMFLSFFLYGISAFGLSFLIMWIKNS